MKPIAIAFSCLLITASPLLAQNAKHGAPMTDQQFVNFAAQTDMVEANLGQLASSVASAQAVKDYAQMVTTDHTTDYQQLSNIARSGNLTMPTAIDSKHVQSLIAPLHKLKGSAFDHQYIADMVKGHTEAIAIYQKEAQDAQDPDLKTYAQQTLPVLQKHLSGAKDLQKSHGK